MLVRNFVVVLGIALLVTPVASATTPTTAGEHVFEKFESPHPYPSSGEAQPMLTWVDQIHFPGAIYIAPHFKKMDLADGDFVVVRSPDGSQRWTYTHFGRHDLGATPDGFFATHIRGDAVVVELYTTGDSSSFGYSIDKYGRGYNDDEIRWFWSQGLGEKMNLARPPEDPESLCGADDTGEAKCYQASEPAIYETSRAVIRLLSNGSAWCTGWLVGNAGHVMTNEHCITSQSQLNNIDFEFMAEGADCATNCASSLACPGTIEASGGTFVTDDAALDYALVIPDTSTGTGTNLPATYGFMKLRQSGAVLDERLYHPQHPAGWGKRIGVNSTYPLDVAMGGFCYASSLTEAPCSGGPGDVGYWTDTQGGSSGSPVLGYSDNKVVAIHHCRGSNFCSTGGAGDDRNRGVPIDAIITDLGALVPPGALCDAYTGPTTLTAINNGNNRVDLGWDTVSGSGITYTVKRAVGACPQASYEEVASGLAGTSYSDTTVSGGITSSYIVMAVNDEGCDSDPSPCADETATGSCIEPPTFDGIESVGNPQTTDCALELDWSGATPICGSSVVYSVYRSETPGFTPGPANLLASCVVAASYVDSDVENQVEYFYVVRAEDDTSSGSGPCNSGNEDGNVVELSGFPTGPDEVYFADDMESGDSNWSHSGTSDTWTLSTARAHSGTTSFFAQDVAIVSDQYLETAVPFALPNVAGITFEFWSWQEIEASSGGCFDGGIVEASTDGGSIWTQLPDPVLITINYDGPVSTSFSNPIGGQDAWCGDPRDWSLYQVDVSAYAGQSVQLRFRMATDTSVSREGWYVDDVRVITPSDCFDGGIFIDGFESGDTNAWGQTIP